MFKIEYSLLAIEDLQQIHEYISSNWNERVAKKVLEKITSNIRKLEQFPLSGVDLSKVIDTPTHYLYIVSEKNYVFYYVENERVRIVRVINEKQDYMQQLFSE